MLTNSSALVSAWHLSKTDARQEGSALSIIKPRLLIRLFHAVHPIFVMYRYIDAPSLMWGLARRPGAYLHLFCDSFFIFMDSFFLVDSIFDSIFRIATTILKKTKVSIILPRLGRLDTQTSSMWSSICSSYRKTVIPVFDRLSDAQAIAIDEIFEI